jgi:cytochrome c5
MLKRTTLLSLLLLTLLAACGKKEPAAPPPPQTAAPAAAPAEAPPVAATAEAPPAAVTAAPATGTAKLAQGDDKGKKVYDSICMACHAAGVAGAPKFGDKALWAPRIAQGMDTLYTHSIKGFQGKAGLMPPKGGNMSLSDADVKAAVDYMVSKAR